MGNQDHEKRHAIMTVVRAIGDGKILKGGDFANANAETVDQKFEQDTAGVRIQFTISWHALGKSWTKNWSMH